MTEPAEVKVPNPCSQEGCTGHLAKFPSCLTEALWEISLYAGESTGSTEAYGHFTLIHFEAEEIHCMGVDLGVPEEQQGPRVVIPAGWYMVEAYDSGRVDHTEYESEETAKQAFALLDEEYAAWYDDDEAEPLDDDDLDSDLPPNAGSAD
jgi:hypothetical protein